MSASDRERGDQVDWVEAERRIRQLLARSTAELDVETVEAVEHYLDHAEYEMALEGLCIDLLLLADDSKVDWSEAISLGRLLRLDQEQVLDVTLWSRLVERAARCE